MADLVLTFATAFWKSGNILKSTGVHILPQIFGKLTVFRCLYCYLLSPSGAKLHQYCTDLSSDMSTTAFEIILMQYEIRFNQYPHVSICWSC